jgi:Carboxypeptidase regulatory-like domain/TonB-dependent Receptor Plug Domain
LRLPISPPGLGAVLTFILVDTLLLRQVQRLPETETPIYSNSIDIIDNLGNLYDSGRKQKVQVMGSNLFRAWRSVLAVLFLGVFSAMALAQSTGRIAGTVVDASGAVVPGATVACTNTQTGLSRTSKTNQDGIFVLPDLPIGNYTLEAQAQGFEAQRREGVSLLTGQSLELKFSLPVGSASQTVQVTEGAPLVQTDASSIQTSVNQKQMQDLPLNGRNALQLTTLTPGTVLTNVGTESGQQDNTGLSVNGLRATQNNFELDGTMYTNRFFDSVPTMPAPDALQEFTIQSSNYSAEFGGAGALVQLSTRSGENEIHGTVFEFLRNTDLNARSHWFLCGKPVSQSDTHAKRDAYLRSDAHGDVLCERAAVRPDADTGRSRSANIAGFRTASAVGNGGSYLPGHPVEYIGIRGRVLGRGAAPGSDFVRVPGTSGEDLGRSQPQFRSGIRAIAN